MRYALIDTMRDNYSISELCQALQVSKSGYYAFRRRTPGPRQRSDKQLLVAIQDIHAPRHTRCYGSPAWPPKFASAATSAHSTA